MLVLGSLKFLVCIFLKSWAVLSDEQSWAAWMTIFPIKWRANEQLGGGDEHQPENQQKTQDYHLGISFSIG